MSYIWYQYRVFNPLIGCDFCMLFCPTFSVFLLEKVFLLSFSSKCFDFCLFIFLLHFYLFHFHFFHSFFLFPFFLYSFPFWFRKEIHAFICLKSMLICRMNQSQKMCFNDISVSHGVDEILIIWVAIIILSFGQFKSNHRVFLSLIRTTVAVTMMFGIVDAVERQTI